MIIPKKNSHGMEFSQNQENIKNTFNTKGIFQLEQALGKVTVLLREHPLEHFGDKTSIKNRYVVL